MSRTTTWNDLEGENAFLILGTVKRLLGQLERESGNPALAGIAQRYYDEATDSDYEHLPEERL